MESASSARTAPIPLKTERQPDNGEIRGMLIELERGPKVSTEVHFPGDMPA